MQELSARVAVGKALELRYGGMKLGFVSYKRKIFNILVGIVQNGVVVRAKIGEKVVNFIYPAPNRTAELTGSVFGGLGSLGIDDIRHRLCARKIHAPVQKRTLCKFARECLPCTKCKNGIERRPQNGRGAVALNLGGVLARIAVRCTAYGAQADVKRLPVKVTKRPEHELSVLALAHFFARAGDKQLIDNIYSLIAAKAKYANCRNLHTRRNGSDRI